MIPPKTVFPSVSLAFVVFVRMVPLREEVAGTARVRAALAISNASASEAVGANWGGTSPPAPPQCGDGCGDGGSTRVADPRTADSRGEPYTTRAFGRGRHEASGQSCD